MNEQQEFLDSPFPAESSDDLMGLLYLGSLEASVSYAGHTFQIRTLKAGEELAITLVTKEYASTVGQGKAYATAIVAASLELVDGHPLLGQLGPDLALPVRQKFDYISKNWYWPVIEHLYNCYGELLKRQVDAFEAFSGESNGSLLTQSPSVDSLSDRASSEAT